jgi:hypothetical protein
MDYKAFFFTDNLSGWKTNAKLLEKNFPDVFQAVQDFTAQHGLTELPFKERVWYFINNVTERKKCVCGQYVNFRGILSKGFNEFCSQSCFNNNQKEENTKRVRKSMLEKHGVEYFSQHDSWEKKVKASKKKRYGNENYNNMEKNKATKLALYGDENYTNVEKRYSTNLERYGVKNFAQSPEFTFQMKQMFYCREGFDKYNFLWNKDEKEFCSFICGECKSEVRVHKQVFRERHDAGLIPCTNCRPLGFNSISSIHQKITEILDKHHILYEENVKKMLGGREEIDIYLPEYKLGIECNGVYFHNELFRSSDYHLNKTLSAENSGVNLIHLFEDEIINKQEIIESIILNKIGKQPRKIYGRNTTIQELDITTYETFMKENHIQGYSKSKIRMGLFYKDELVSAMGFSLTRLGIGKQDGETYEMIRYANKKYTNVVGAASKLYKYFIQNYNPPQVVSYADRRLFGGEVYLKLGFEKVGTSKPNYW